MAEQKHYHATQRETESVVVVGKFVTDFDRPNRTSRIVENFTHYCSTLPKISPMAPSGMEDYDFYISSHFLKTLTGVVHTGCQRWFNSKIYGSYWGCSVREIFD